MIADLGPSQTALAEYMSELSEEAYAAGWMQGLEYTLWKAVVDGPRAFGRLHLGEAQIERLKELSSRCGGWVYFDESTEETFIDLGRWKMMYAKNVARYEDKLG